MAQDRASVKRLILTLTVIGVFGSLFLAFVFNWTNPYILEHEARAREEAIMTALPDAVRYEEEVRDDRTFYIGFDEAEQQVGVALTVTKGGYQGMIDVMVGVDPDRERIIDISILNHEETPGLGARITEERYKENFRDKPIEEYEIVNRPPEEPYEVENIAGATISAETVMNIVMEAGNIALEHFGGGN